jgi:hypothetical protein
VPETRILIGIDQVHLKGATLKKYVAILLAGFLLAGSGTAEAKPQQPPTLKKKHIERAVQGWLNNLRDFNDDGDPPEYYSTGTSNCRRVSRTKGKCDAFYTRNFEWDYELPDSSTRCPFTMTVSTKKLHGGQVFAYPPIIDFGDRFWYLKIPGEAISCEAPFIDNNYDGNPD